MFLTIHDYPRLIKDQNLQQVIQGNEALLEQAGLDAQAEMESYLNQRFDVAVEFAKTGDDRNPLLVMYLMDMALYHLHTRITPRNIPEVRGIRYENAINWLNKVASGKLTPQLTRLADGGGEPELRSRHGGNEKYKHQW